MIIDNEFKSLLPPLPEEDYRGLEESIKKEGCRDPLVVWGEILVDGHNRYEICVKNNISYQTVQREFKDRNEVILWIISNQLSRRNLTAFQRSELALRLKPQLSKEAKERQGERVDLSGNIGAKSCESDRTGRTANKMAKIAGVSEKTIHNTETILTKGTEEDVADVRSGKVSISKKAKEIKQRDKPEVTQPQKEEDKDIKDFEGAFMANSKDMLMVFENIQEDCKKGVPIKYRAKFNKIIKDIEDLREFIGGQTE